MIGGTQEYATILIVDDNPKNLQILLDHLKEAGFRTLIARNSESALRQADFASPDLILLDVMMPGINGFETCRRLKQMKRTRDIPVIFLTALVDAVDKVKGIEAGGVDYVAKPFDGLELLARIKTHLTLHSYRKELEKTQQELRQANEALLESRKKLELVAKTDPLTQLPNRREILEKLQQENIRFERNQRSFVVAICDIDNFKHFNDTYGHDCGDFILIVASRLMRSIIRKQDLLARWGGEEFLFAFLETGLSGGQIICEKIRETIAEHVFQYKEHQLLITMTFGLSEFNSDTPAIEENIKKADQALYLGKRRGKNCIVPAKPERRMLSTL